MIYFYPHRYLRDRQLDTIKNWKESHVVNHSVIKNRTGAQVAKEKAVKSKLFPSIKQLLPLLNIKLRPKAAPKNSAVYIWGGLLLTGKFIVDLDNPWALVGYNRFSMSLYRWIIKHILLSNRCIEIRCISEACRTSILLLFGIEVYKKTVLKYPVSTIKKINEYKYDNKCCRFLFVGTQFQIKGGEVLLKACKLLSEKHPNSTFTFITHLPECYIDIVDGIKNCKIVEANLTRKEVEEYMLESDVLIHPSYMESFGMVLLEAISCGLAVVTTDMYASSEIVINDTNGILIKPPISAWNSHLPTENFLVPDLMRNMGTVNYDEFTLDLYNAMDKLSSNFQLLNEMKQNSILHFEKKFLGIGL